MAGGGWSKRGSGVPLAARVRSDAEHARDVPGGSERPDLEPACPARHCWVADAVDGRGAKRPGLLVEWRQDASGWQGRVVYAALLRPARWGLVEEWVPAELLTPM